MKIIDCKQGSDEWIERKTGKPGASSFNRIITSQGNISKQRDGYLHQLAAEALVGYTETEAKTPAIIAGLEREDESRKLYEVIYGVEVQQVGLILEPNERYLCSPDGLVIKPDNGNSRGVELKNPLPKTQVEYLKRQRIPPDYVLQIQGSLLVTDLERWDFMSYSPGLPPLVIECQRDEELISRLQEQLEKFCDELAELIQKIRTMG